MIKVHRVLLAVIVLVFVLLCWNQFHHLTLETPPLFGEPTEDIRIRGSAIRGTVHVWPQTGNGRLKASINSLALIGMNDNSTTRTFALDLIRHHPNVDIIIVPDINSFSYFADPSVQTPAALLLVPIPSQNVRRKYLMPSSLTDLNKLSAFINNPSEDQRYYRSEAILSSGVPETGMIDISAAHLQKVLLPAMRIDSVADDQKFEEYLVAASSFILVLHAPWCGHCKRFMKVFEPVAEITIQGGLPFYRLDLTHNDVSIPGIIPNAVPQIFLFVKGQEYSVRHPVVSRYMPLGTKYQEIPVFPTDDVMGLSHWTHFLGWLQQDPTIPQDLVTSVEMVHPLKSDEL